MLLLYLLTSQMISASVMVQAAGRPQVARRPLALPTTAQTVPQGDRWYIDFDANAWRYRISNERWNDESQTWHSCADGLAKTLSTLPETPAWQVTEFCKKYVFTLVQ